MKFFKKINFSINLSGFRKNRSEFYEQLAKSYDNKEALKDFLNSEYEISINAKTRDTSRAFALKIMRSRLASGSQSKFSQLLTGIMPASDQIMLSALDDAPDKSKIMRSIASNIRDQKELIGLVKGKLLPPLMILPGAYAFCYVMATKSLPIIVKIAPPEVWSSYNMFVRRFAEFIANYGFITIGIIISLISLLVYQLPRWTGRSRNYFEQVKPGTAALLFPVAPFILPLAIYRDVQAGMIFSALSVMLQSGKTLNVSLEDIRKSSQPWMRSHIKRILSHLEVHTTEYTKAFSKGLLSPQLLARLSSQIRTNPRFDQVLIDLGGKGSVEIRKEVEIQTSKINFMLLSAGGLMVVLMMTGQLSISGSMTEEMSPQKMQIKRMKAAQIQNNK